MMEGVDHGEMYRGDNKGGSGGSILVNEELGLPNDDGTEENNDDAGANARFVDSPPNDANDRKDKFWAHDA